MAIATYQRYDNFTVSLMVALGVHAFILLGVAFVLEIGPARLPDEALDVVLVNWRTEEAPEEADFLAQADQQGGGVEDAETTRPSSPESGLLPTPEDTEGADALTMEEQAPAESEAARAVVARETPRAAELQQPTEVEREEPPLPTADELMQQSLTMASLQPELAREPRPDARLKRREFISANTREYEHASYMQAWVAKVERIGNLNYPAVVRERRLFGDLLMTVGINQDGSIESIVVRRSSGLPELDEAAKHIVRLAAPYAPLPDNIARDVDVLHITRTWRFSEGGVR